MRLIAMPGDRSRMIVVTKLIAPAVVEIVRNSRASAKKSMFRPGEYVLSVYGTYANHPACGACPTNGLTYRKRPDARNVQYVNAFSRGYAMSRAPVNRGMR